MSMRTIGKAVLTAVFGAALILAALPGISAAADPGDHSRDLGEKIFSGKVGPWTEEVRLVDMKEQMEKAGVSPKTAERYAGKHHLMLFVTDPATGKPAAVEGKVVVTGPDKASSSKVPLVAMGGHIGADVDMPVPGKYTFKADIESAGRKGSATFSYTLK
jgi:hypothetical protein